MILRDKYSELINNLDEKIFSINITDRLARSSDASFFQIEPEAVFFPREETDILNILNYARGKKIGLTFRAGGTSLSGQTVGKEIIVDISRGWRNFRILNEGKEIELQPGVILEHANLYLKKYGRRIGPDPASGKACMIGGIVANNASGITSGTIFNTYKTLKYIRFILPGGTVVDTSGQNADTLLKEKEPEIYRELSAIRDEIRSGRIEAERIRRLFKMKNTVGYSVNAFLDYEKPVDILAHLMVGSEGTLGFVSNIVYETIEDKPFKATVLLGFNDLETAGDKVLELKEAGAAAIEIINFASVETIRNNDGMPSIIHKIPQNGSALLVEFHASDEKALKTKIKEVQPLIESIPLRTPFVYGEEERAILWKARKELFATTGGRRPSGSTEITEDVVVPVHRLSETLKKIDVLLSDAGFKDMVIFGHARDGSFHFNFSADFSESGAADRFWTFSERLAKFICTDMEGALKGEHGTGRAIAPFLEIQWGEKIVSWMKRIKQVVDPGNILNPGVIFSSENYREYPLKMLPRVDEIIDKCVECGFCENQCPSRDLTLTPRQRIVVSRYMERFKNSADRRHDYLELKNNMKYRVVETCAADGLCELACPLDINTGIYVKKLRSGMVSAKAEKIASITLKYFNLTVATIRGGMKTAGVIRKITGDSLLQRASSLLNRKVTRHIPVWNKYMPLAPATRVKPDNGNGQAEWVYFPSCVSRTMGNFPEQELPPLVKSILEIADYSGVSMHLSSEYTRHCCGLAYSSKGFKNAALSAARKTTEFLYRISGAGEKKILMDTSPCTHHMKNYGEILDGEYLEKWKKLRIFDVIEFLHSEILPKVKIHPLDRRVTFHPVCSVKRMGLESRLIEIIQSCSNDVYIPPITGCCASAGDRGLHYPELSRSATAVESELLRKSGAEKYYSTSRTCEIGMSNAVDKPFESVVFLVRDAIEAAREKQA